jgi:Ras and EF-hand domain-containing protein
MKKKNIAGQERFRSITQSYFRKADGVMMLFDVTNERSFVNVRQWMQSIRDWHDKVLPMVLCGTKSDLRPASEHQGRSCVQAHQAAQMADELHAPYVETSAKSGTNVFDALICLTRYTNQMAENGNFQTQIWRNIQISDR